MSGLLSLTDRLSWLLAIVSGMVLTGLVGLTFVDVLLRYLFSSPILGSKDILEMGMVIVVFLAAPFTWRIGGHIVVDLLPDYKSDWLVRLRDVGVRLTGLVIFGLLSWQGWLRAEEAAFMGEATNMIELPYRPFFFALIAGVVVQSWILLLEAAAVCLGIDHRTKVLGVHLAN